MVKRVGVVIVWLLATLGTASLTYAAVSRAGGAVGDNPAVPVAASDIAARVPTTLSGTAPSTTAASTTSEGATTTTSSPGTSITTVTTAGISQPTSTTTVPPGTTTSTAAAQQTTTTTTQPASRTEWRTVEGVGTVGVSVQGNRLELVSATPVAPFHVEAVETEGDSIEVEFKSGSAGYRIRAELDDGEVVWDVEDHD